MIRREDVYRIGRLGKPHGVKGEVTLHVDDDVFDRVDADYLVLDVDGILVPFFMEEYRFRSDSVALVKFRRVDTQQQAAELTGAVVYFPRHLSDAADEEPSLEMLVGYTIVEAATGQPVGVVDAIDSQTANVLFCLADGRLLPATDALVCNIDSVRREIIMDIPEGLLDL